MKGVIDPWLRVQQAGFNPRTEDFEIVGVKTQGFLYEPNTGTE